MRIYIIFFALIFSACGSSEDPKGKTFEIEGIAIGGYDPVAYFEQSEARLGDENITSEVDSVTYWFASTENKNVFDADPEKYIPAYGGWCAYAVAETSTKMQPDPAMWQVQDGRLLLFYANWKTSLMGNLKEKWNTDPAGYLGRADSNWVFVEQE